MSGSSVYSRRVVWRAIVFCCAFPFVLLFVLRLLGEGWHAVTPGVHEMQLTRALRDAHKSGVKQIAVKDIANFKWEWVCMFDTAVAQRDVIDAVGQEMVWNESTVPWLYNENYWTLIFIGPSKAVQLVKLRKGKTGNPSIRGASACAERATAAFSFLEFRHSRHSIRLHTGV